MRIFCCELPEHARLWQKFVMNTEKCTAYHRWEWKAIIERAFQFPTFYLMAVERDDVMGILPLVWQKIWMGRGCLCSVPFLSSGGIVAENQAAERALLQEAIAIAKGLRVESLELRNLHPQDLGLFKRSDDKITLVLPIHADPGKTWAALDTKMRTKIRRSEKFGLTAEFGKENLLDEFYSVFAENMRDLGTPVYGRNFFAEILKGIRESVYLCVVRHQGMPAAASFLIGFRETIEAKWSSSLRRYLHVKPNMFLYWKLLSFAGEQGYRIFDFGRSTVGSGTHDFKSQWGAEALPLNWVYWTANGETLAQANPHSAKYRLPIWVWQKLPLTIANQFGPRLVRHFPS